MQCYYQREDGPWIKGHMQTISSQMVHFWPAEAKQDKTNSFMLRSDLSEFLFVERGVRVTGYQEYDREKNLFQLVAVDVSPGWTKHEWME